MHITIRPVTRQEKCGICGVRFNEDNDFTCPAHGTGPRRVYLDLWFAGIGREKIRADMEGDPLGVDKAKRLRERIKEDAAVAPTEAEAKRIVLRNYVPRNKAKHRFRTIRERFLVAVEKRKAEGKVGPAYVKDLRGYLPRIFTLFDPLDIADVRTGLVVEWLEEMDTSENNKRRCLGYLSAILSWARERELLNTYVKLPQVKVYRKKKKGLYRDDQDAILAHIPDKHKPIFEFAMETGRRINEFRAIKVRDVDLDRGVYTFGAYALEEYKEHPKEAGRAGEEYPLTPELRAIVKRALKRRIVKPESHVFEYPSQYGNWIRYRDARIRRIFNKARTAAGYSADVKLNMFGRHSKGFQIMVAGGTFDDVGLALGNAPETARKHYADVDKRRLTKIINMSRKAPTSPNVPKRKNRNSSD